MNPDLFLRKTSQIVICVVVIGICSYAQKSPARKSLKETASPESHFDSAQTFQIAGDLERAADQYRKGISLALERVGNLKVARHEYNSGYELLQRSVLIDQDNLDAQIDLGIAAFKKGDYAECKRALAPVLAKDPGSFRARNLMGKVLFMQGDFEGAATELQAALSISADFDVAYSLALSYLEMKKVSQATPLADEMKASMPKSPELYVLLGQAYRYTGYYDLAIKEYTAALTLDPKRPRVHSYLGMTYVALGGAQNLALAKPQFEAEIASTPEDYSSRYYLGLIAFQTGELATAETNLKKAQVIAPADPAAVLLLGKVYEQRKDWNAAIEYFKKAVTLSEAARSPSQITGAHTSLADAYRGAGQTDKADQELAKAKAAAPPEQEKGAPTPQEPATGMNSAQDVRAMLLQNLPEAVPPNAAEQSYLATVSKLLGNAYNNLGVIDARKSSYVDAADEFSQAAHWDPSVPQLDRNLALASFRAEKYADAVPPLERLSRSSPGDQNLRQMLALSYYMTNQFKESAATFRPMLDELPNNPGLLLAAGISFVRVGDFTTGQKLFARAFETGRGTAEVHLIIGQAYADQDREQEALAEFKQALELNAVVPEAHYYIGMVLFKKGQLDEAIGEFQKELLVNPKNTAAMYQTAYIRMQQHQAPEAAKLLAEVIKQEPSNSDAHYQLGKALLEQGDAVAATRELEASVKLHPTDYAYFQLSNAYARTGRSDDARQALENFEKMKPKPKTPPGQ